MTAIQTHSPAPSARASRRRAASEPSLRATQGSLKLASNLGQPPHRLRVRVFEAHIPGESTLQCAVNIRLKPMGHFRPIGDLRLLETLERQVSALS